MFGPKCSGDKDENFRAASRFIMCSVFLSSFLSFSTRSNHKNLPALPTISSTNVYTILPEKNVIIIQIYPEKRAR